MNKQCNKCQIDLTDLNKVKNRLICIKCKNLQQIVYKKQRQAKINSELSQICEVCNIDFSNVNRVHGKNICRSCTNKIVSEKQKEKNLLNNEQKKCNKCNIILNENNKTSGRNRCKVCTNKINRDKNQILEKTSKVCITCNELKTHTLYKSILHKECSNCINKKTKNITKQEYDELHPNETRECLICLQIKLNNEFNYHTNNYRNQCNKCLNGVDYYRHYKHKKNYMNTPIDYTKEEFNKLIKNFILKDCFYCGKQGTLSDKNGIDRIDSNINYTDDNCVSCCTMCNIMKKDMDIASFIRKCCEIYKYNFDTSLIDERLNYHSEISFISKTYAIYDKYIKNADDRSIIFELPKEEFSKLIKQKCYLCGFLSKGIYRKTIVKIIH